MNLTVQCGLLVWLTILLGLPSNGIAGYLSGYPLDSPEAIREIKSLKLTTDLGFDLNQVLQQEDVQEACDRHFGRLDKETDKLPAASLTQVNHIQDMLYCGKELFFRGSLESKVGFPSSLIDGILEVFPDEVGPAFTKLGFIADPLSENLPVGMTQGAGNPWGPLSAVTGSPMTITCAACHFGKTNDGRYSVGMPNQDLDFGKMMSLIVYVGWIADKDKNDPNKWPLEIQEYYRYLDDKVKRHEGGSDFLYKMSRIVATLRLSNVFYRMVGFSIPTYGELVTYLSGTPNQYYASTPMFPVGAQHRKGMIMSSPLVYELENFKGQVERGTERPLASFIPTNDLENFSRAAFIFQTGKDEYAKDRYADALSLYLRTLETPKNPVPEDPIMVRKGKKVWDRECQECHNASRGRSLDAYTSEEMGTPKVLINPFVDYEPPHRLASGIYETYLKHLGPIAPQPGIYARTMKGLWTKKNLMVNGSVRDLDHLFCLGTTRGEKGMAVNEPMSDAVHMDLCDDYSVYEKRVLKAFLKSW